MNDPAVDILMLCRPGTHPPAHVREAIENQQRVRVEVHTAAGPRAAGDRNRWQTIARGRNRLKHHGQAPWAMFVDDDVVLDPDCAATLVEALIRSPTLGAIAADSAGEQLDPRWDGHIGMAACLFRRQVLEQLHFRSTEKLCECWCCCDDLRQAGIGITYCAPARATHLGPPRHAAQRNGSGRFRHRQRSRPQADLSRGVPRRRRGTTQGVVLAAFDRRDVGRFQHQFLHSLRSWGNDGRVIAVAYGLYPSEIERLRRLAAVDVIPRPANGEMAPVRRLTDFAAVTGQLAADVPVAYWDIADVVFQSALDPLWQEVARRPDKLLAVVEPKSFPNNAIIPAWSLSIHDPHYRARALDLLKRNGFLNSGFAAGTASTLHAYFEAAGKMRRGPELRGTSDWGDQMCLNLYCHSDPSRWQAIHEGWNFCVHDRPAGEMSVTPDGIVWSRRIGKVPVAHGNARSLRQFSILVHAGP